MPDQASADLERRKAAAETRRAIAESELRTAEALQARAEARAAAANAEAAARRAEEKADAEHRLALAEVAQKEAEAAKVADLAARERDAAADQARRDAEKADAETRKAVAEADAETRKAVAEADAATLKAVLPEASTLTPLEGTVTADDTAGIIAETVASTLLRDAATEIAAAATFPDDARVLVVTDRSLAASDWVHRWVDQQVRRLTGDVESIRRTLVSELGKDALEAGEQGPTVLEEAIASGQVRSLFGPVAAGTAAAKTATALPAIVGAAADVAGFVQSNYQLLGRTVDAKAEPVLAAVAGALATKGTAVVIDGFHTVPDTHLLRRHDQLLQSRSGLIGLRLLLAGRIADRAEALRHAEAAVAEAETAIAQAEAAEDATAIVAAGRAHDDATDRAATAEADLSRLEALLAAAEKIEDHVDAFAADVATPRAGDDLSPLAQACLREALHVPSRDDRPAVTHVLHVAVSSMGGESQIRQRRFRAPVIRYVGACTFSVLAAAVDGAVVHAETRSLAGHLTYKLKAGRLGKGGKLRRIELTS